MTRTGDPIGPRVKACLVFVLVAFGVLAARVVQVQALDGSRYQREAVGQLLRRTEIDADRGSIFDRNGRDLALTIRRSSVYADPTLVDDVATTAARRVRGRGVPAAPR